MVLRIRKKNWRLQVLWLKMWSHLLSCGLLIQFGIIDLGFWEQYGYILDTFQPNFVFSYKDEEESYIFLLLTQRNDQLGVRNPSFWLYSPMATNLGTFTITFPIPAGLSNLTTDKGWSYAITNSNCTASSLQYTQTGSIIPIPLLLS